ncbi:MAG: cytochrome c biogenesis protein CcsA [Planctomycetota bacterium]
MKLVLLGISALLPLLYLGLLLDYGATFLLQSRTTGRTPWLWGVVGLHGGFLAAQIFYLDHPPLQGGAALMGLLAFCTALVYLVVELATGERRTGAFMMVPVLLFQYGATLLGTAQVGTVAPQPEWLGLHVPPALLAFVGLTVSAVYAALHLALRRNLKRHHVGVFFDRLPSLDLLATMSWHSLLLGFGFLTLAIVTGAVYFGPTAGVSALFDGNPWLAAKVAAGVVAWLIYLATVVGRFAGSWSSGRISRFSLTGFCAVVVVLGLSAIFP